MKFESNIHQRIYTIALLLFFCFSCISCGGGTQGTSIRRFDGQVLNTNNQPLNDIVVTILDSGESAVTDDLGLFRIDSDQLDSNVNFTLQSSEVDAQFVLNDISDDARHVNVQVRVDPTQRQAEVVSFSARVWMVGTCDPFFDNGLEIKQIKRLPIDTKCTLRLRIFGDGTPRAAVPYALQKRECGKSKPWRVVSTGETTTTPVLGQVEIPFIFQDPKRICEYRVVIPFNYLNYRPLYYPIETLVEQSIE